MKATPLVLMLALAACSKSAEREHAEAERSAQRAERAVQNAERATQKAEVENKELSAAIARERVVAIDRLDEAIRAIDMRLLELDPIVDTGERDRLTERRDLLRADQELIQKSTDENWYGVKQRIDRDLVGGGRI